MKYEAKLIDGKMMLISRDIQIGDRFIDGILNEEFTYEEIGSLNDSDFKVIGQISSEATWIKEGDEFDETKIKIWQKPSFKENWKDFPFRGKHKSSGEEKEIFPYSPSFSGLVWLILNPSPDLQLIEVKGPCGHYH